MRGQDVGMGMMGRKEKSQCWRYLPASDSAGRKEGGVDGATRGSKNKCSSS